MKRRRVWLFLIAMAAAIAAANIPLTTKQGVNHVVTEHSLPAYMKGIDFIDRDIHYRRLAADVTAGVEGDEAKAKTTFAWTRANIRDTPEGYPIVDDHIWHIIIRGYGEADQKADVFTTLLSYAGVPAYFIFVGPKPELTLSFAKADGAWRVADVANGVMFRSRGGSWATAEDVAADPAFAASQGPAAYRGVPYARFLTGFRAPIPPDLTRPDMQVPGARTWFAIKKMFGSSGRQWEMRPPSRQAAP